MDGETTRTGSPLAGILLVAGAAVVWSTGGLIVRWLGGLDPWTLIFWRSVAAAAALVGLILVQEGRGSVAVVRRMGWAGMGVGACFALASTAFVVALQLTTVAKTLLILSASPLIAALLGRIFLGEPVRPLTWATIAAVMAGIAIMVSDQTGGGSLAGDLTALLTAAGYAGAIVLTRHHRHVRMTPAVCTGAVMAALIALPFASPWSVPLAQAPLLAFFGAGQLALGLALFSFGARLIPAAQASLLGTLEPILGPVWVWLLLGEAPTVTALLGGAIVLAAVLVGTTVDLARGRSALVEPAS